MNRNQNQLELSHYADYENLHSFIMEEVRGIKGVQNTKTLIILKEY